MRVESFATSGDGLALETGKGKIGIQVCSEAVIRVVYTLNGEFSERESLVVVNRKLSPCRWRVDDRGERLAVSTDRLRLEVARDTAAFTWREATGGLLTREPSRGGKSLREIGVEDLRAAESSPTGEQAGGEGGGREGGRRACQAKLEFEWAEGEALYGLGQHEEGTLNRRGTHQYLYQQNLKVAVPMLVSSRGYGVLVDACSLMTYHDDAFGSYLWTDAAGEMDYYFIYGPEFDEIIAGYRQLTGRAAMLPRWAFGYVQSKERYRTQEELISVAREYRERGIPLDVIVQDWHSWPGELWGQKTFDGERFPDPERMMEELHAMKVRLMVSIWPKMTNNGPNHVEMREQGCLLGDGVTYDAFSEKARRLYWKQAYEGIFSKGTDAWWADCTEPFEQDWRGEVKPEPWQRMLINTGYAKKYLEAEQINGYSLMHSRGLYEGQRGSTDRKRVVNLTRSAYAGQQRYGTITWSGDIAASWETLRRQIPEGLNFCASGLPYWTLDIGAFFVGARDYWFWAGRYPEGCEDKGYRELYVRWFQYGAFLPMFRSHGTETPREVWRFGEPGSASYDTLVKFIFLRYRLLPYLYSLAGRVTQDHYTPMRALAFDFRDDRRAHDVRDQYMFGPAFLVSPVTRPMYFEAGSRPLEGVSKARPVYLPAGCDWYDFWTGQRLAGGRRVSAEAPLEIMPIHVRAGSVVPMGPRVQHAEQDLEAPIELRVYPGAPGEFVYYEDGNDGYGYEQGLFATTAIRWDEREQRLTLGARRGGFPGMTARRTFNVVRVREGRGAGLEESGPEATVVYEGGEETVRV